MNKDEQKKQLDAYTKPIIDSFKVGKSKTDISQEIREKVDSLNSLIIQADGLGLKTSVWQNAFKSSKDLTTPIRVTITETIKY